LASVPRSSAGDPPAARIARRAWCGAPGGRRGRGNASGTSRSLAAMAA